MFLQKVFLRLAFIAVLIVPAVAYSATPNIEKKCDLSNAFTKATTPILSSFSGLSGGAGIVLTVVLALVLVAAAAFKVRSTIAKSLLYVMGAGLFVAAMLPSLLQVVFPNAC